MECALQHNVVRGSSNECQPRRREEHDRYQYAARQPALHLDDVRGDRLLGAPGLGGRQIGGHLLYFLEPRHHLRNLLDGAIQEGDTYSVVLSQA